MLCVHEAALLAYEDQTQWGGTYYVEESDYEFGKRKERIEIRSRDRELAAFREEAGTERVPALDFFRDRKDPSGFYIYDMRKALEERTTDAFSMALARRILAADPTVKKPEWYESGRFDSRISYYLKEGEKAAGGRNDRSTAEAQIASWGINCSVSFAETTDRAGRRSLFAKMTASDEVCGGSFTAGKAVLEGGYRDTEQEKRVDRVLRRYLPVYVGTDQIYAAFVSDDGLFDFLRSGLAVLEKYGTVHGTDAFRTHSIRPVPQVKIGVSVDSGIMDLSVTSHDLSEEELLALLG